MGNATLEAHNHGPTPTLIAGQVPGQYGELGSNFVYGLGGVGTTLLEG